MINSKYFFKGLSCIKKLTEENLKILMLDIKDPPKNLLRKNKNLIFKKMDVTNYSAIKDEINIFYKKYKSIDYLINMTGVLWFDKDISVTKIDLSLSKFFTPLAKEGRSAL